MDYRIHVARIAVFYVRLNYLWVNACKIAWYWHFVTPIWNQSIENAARFSVQKFYVYLLALVRYVDWFWEMSTKLIYRYQNKQFTIFHSTVYYIKTITVRIMRLNRFMYYNNLKFQKRLMAIQSCLFLLFERTTTSLSLAKLHKHIIKRYVKAIFGEY